MFFKKKINNKDSGNIDHIFEKVKLDMEGKKIAEKALSYRTLKNYSKAHSLLNTSLKEYNYQPAIILIATTYIIEKKFTDAINWIQKKLIEIEDSNPIKIELLANLGAIYFTNLKEYDNALDIYFKAYSLFPMSKDQLYISLRANLDRDVCQIYYLKGNFELAKDYGNKRIQINPDCEQTQKILNMVNHQITNLPDDLLPILPLFEAIGNSLSLDSKISYSNWAKLRTDEWTENHSLHFTNTLIYFFSFMKRSNQLDKLDNAFSNIADSFPNDFEPNVSISLSSEVKLILLDLMGKYT